MKKIEKIKEFGKKHWDGILVCSIGCIIGYTIAGLGEKLVENKLLNPEDSLVGGPIPTGE